jgi:Flp pilus assembly protein TadG
VTVFTTILSVTLIFVAGLVVDGGRILAARRAAANIADSAARAGAQVLDEGELRRSGRHLLDVAAAERRASEFLAISGHPGDVTATPTAVSVRVTTPVELHILGLGGLGSVTVTGAGHAQPIRAVTGSEP